VLEQASEALPVLPAFTREALLATLAARHADVGAEACNAALLLLVDDGCQALDACRLPVDDATLAALAPRCARLRALDVRHCENITGACAAHACACTRRVRSASTDNTSFARSWRLAHSAGGGGRAARAALRVRCVLCVAAAVY
jgi:hypothetical protein